MVAISYPTVFIMGIPASQRVKAHHANKKMQVGTSYLPGEGQRIAFIVERSIDG